MTMEGTESKSVGSTGSAGSSGNASVNSDTILATAGYDHNIKLWHIHTSLCVKTFQHPDSQINALCITPDRNFVAAAGYQHIRLYDVHANNAMATMNFEGINKNVSTIGFNKDGQWMFSGGEDNFARIYDLRSPTPQCQKVFETHKSPVTCAVLHPNQTELIVSDYSGTIHVWDLRTDGTQQMIPDQNSSVPVQSVDIDPLGNFLAAVNNKGDCYIWKLDSTGEALKLDPFRHMKIHKRYALKCKFSPDSNYLATTSADQTAKIWRVSDFQLHSELTCAGQRWVWDAAWTGDSQFLITGSSDNLARLWSIESGQSKREYNGHQKPISCLAYRDVSM